MKLSVFVFVLVLACVLFAQAPTEKAPAPPSNPEIAKAPAAATARIESQPAGESLTYTVNWPTGLSLGEAHLRTSKRNTSEGPRVETEFHLDASVPGFPVLENHHSVADGEFCSIDFKKQYTHGKRKADETMTFDQAARKATRETKGGGKSELSTAACAKDALAYIGYVRRELGAGRLPPRQQVYYGAGYDLKIDFQGTAAIKLGEAEVNADRVSVAMKGPVTEMTFEVYFAKDAGRTPVLVRVPLQLATFSMELVR
jgi:hypothetical protein